jgi:hypothetical protein
MILMSLKNYIFFRKVKGYNEAYVEPCSAFFPEKNRYICIEKLILI